MNILPAIDLKNGQCVRLRQGDYSTAHKVAEDATAIAKDFLLSGATFLHMVDLDGAKDGSHANYHVVQRVIEETGAAIQLGGGIRSMEDIETVLGLGVCRVIIGSAAVSNPALVEEAVRRYSTQIAVSIDAKDGTVRTQGWLQDSGESYLTFAQKMEACGVHTLIFTDISKDGMLSGPNFEQLTALHQAVSCNIVASGGVSTLDDIRQLKQIGMTAAIVGKAVYTGTLDIEEAIQEAK